MTTTEKLKAIAQKNRIFAALVKLENQAQRLRNSGCAVPNELAATIERGRRAYENAKQQMETTQ